MKVKLITSLLVILGYSSTTFAGHHVSDTVIKSQREKLAENTIEKGFGPQAPRDIDSINGDNHRFFGTAPDFKKMNLCNIHFHKNAEHKGGEFTAYAGNGDGKGNETGYVYSGLLTGSELTPFKNDKLLSPGDTIEVHYVYSSAKVQPGSTLGACMANGINNPALRVEGQVYVLVNDDNALDFSVLNNVAKMGDYYQAPNLPSNTGKPIEYAGSTTGPSYNEKGSPFQVTWSVRPMVTKVNISTVVEWLNNNPFKEHKAHGVRNLITNPKLLSGS
jgi:hypothetical protein